jgi:lipoprotein-anchoring transpeptidase ErfK/SrfK
MKRQIIYIALIILAITLLPGIGMANSKVSRFAAMVPVMMNDSRISQALVSAETQQLQPAPVNCIVEMPKKQEYSAKFISVRKKAFVAKNELFETEVLVQNIGNMPWFSGDSGCNMPVTNLGTERTRDRISIFYPDKSVADSKWLGGNRIKMETKRVDPQGIATFTFISQSPNEDGYYREFFAPVVEGVSWLDAGRFYMDTMVGEPIIDPAQKQYWDFIYDSTDLAKLNLTGEKSISVSLSTQKMYLKIGDVLIREFMVSTGKRKTPTPVGVTKVYLKQEIRISKMTPHYIMPKWLMFRMSGYGIHALPSLANDHGVYWNEALSHIGEARSHGCIRLLPSDAAFAFDFAEVGTKVIVQS